MEALCWEKTKCHAYRQKAVASKNCKFSSRAAQAHLLLFALQKWVTKG